MAHALVPAAASAFAANAPPQGLHEAADGFSYLFKADAEGLTIDARRGAEQAQGLIRWVIGAGAQGQTPLVETRDGVRESRLSYFPQARRFGITIGQSVGASAHAADALGRLQSRSELRMCVSCHASAITPDLQPVVPGVQCARCHPGAAAHAAGHGTPLNPGKMQAADQVRLCGGCHRLTPPAGPNEPENVRFQPLRLMKSRCFASGRLACTTCHVAHQDARRDDPAFYNGKCVTCHAGGAHLDARRTGNCIGCHMPVVALHPALQFTDHYIRVLPAATARLVPRS